MKVKATVEIYTTQESEIEKGSVWTVDFVDDTRKLVWLAREGVVTQAGDTFVSTEVFNIFFSKVEA